MLFSFFHTSAYGGHLGRTKTLQKVSEKFYHPELRKTIIKLVKECDTCKTSKSPNKVYFGPLVTTEPKNIFDKVFLDLMGPLPRTKNGMNSILLVVEELSKFVWLIPLRNMTTKSVVEKLESVIFTHFGNPKMVISDNGSCFKSYEFKEYLFKRGILHHKLTYYQARSNKAERYFKNLKAQLKCYFSQKQDSWNVDLNYLEMSLNNSYNEAIQDVPFGLMFNRKDNDLLCNLWKVDDIIQDTLPKEEFSERLKKAISSLKSQNIRNSKNKVYCEGEKHPFSENDKVFVKTHSLSNKANKFSSKLGARFVGPFIIKFFVNPVTVVVQNVNNLSDIRKVHLSELRK